MAQIPQELLDRALSIRQPYVELILREVKRNEYRSRITHLRGRVYLYASLSLGDVAWGARQGIPLEEQEKLPRGVIVGSIEIVGCIRRKSQGDFAWKLAHPQRYPEVFKPLGQPQPGIWRPRWH